MLVVDDDESILALLRELLERAAFEVVTACRGHDAIAALRAGLAPDLVVLDVEMPGIDGLSVLEHLRSVDRVPVLMLSARSSEPARVRGLRAGADDYVGKPFGRQELLARVEALLRRSAGSRGVDDSYRDGLLTVDFAQGRVICDGAELSLTPREFCLLAALVRRPGQVLCHDELLAIVWRDAYGISNDEVRTYISYIRRKLRDRGVLPECIETVRGSGYRYRPPAA